MRASSAARASLTPDTKISGDLQPSRGWLAAWYAGFAVYAGLVAVFSGPHHDRVWGTWAFGGYAAAALAAVVWRSHGKDAALAASLAGALVAPVTWLATQVPPTPDVRVLWRAAALLLQHGTPYLSPAQIAEVARVAGPVAYNPYLPFMSVFGMPKAADLPGLAGDTRVWVTVASVALFALAFRIAGRGDPLRCGLLAAASPVVAFPLAVGITDPPVLALLCLVLALLGRKSRTLPVWPAAIVLGVACAMKATAWPALPVVTAMLAARDGARAAARFAAIATATIAVLFAAFAPAVLGKPAALLQNIVLFPLGMTRAQTPAASPLPGHLLAATGPAGHLAAVALMIAAGLAVAVSLVIRPPADSPAAARRLALAFALIFALSPAVRFGYFTYPLGLCGWLALTHGGVRARRPPLPAGTLPPAPPDGHAATFQHSAQSAWPAPSARPGQPPRPPRPGQPPRPPSSPPEPPGQTQANGESERVGGRCRFGGASG